MLPTVKQNPTLKDVTENIVGAMVYLRELEKESADARMVREYLHVALHAACVLRNKEDRKRLVDDIRRIYNVDIETLP